MISSAEFQQKLRSGQIYEALALVVQETIELEITTQMTEDPHSDPAADGEYLRTKINLLTGQIHNEVDKNIVTNPNFAKLQRLHIDQIVASQLSVRSYLEQIQAILAILPPSSTAPSTSSPSHPERYHSSLEPIELLAALPIAAIDPTGELEEDLDLSIDRDGEVWEEWVEDEDFIASSDIPAPPLISLRIPHPEPPSQWVGRPLDSIAIKPLVPRTTAIPIDPATHWEKFEPEYMSADLETQPRIKHYPDPQQMDKILADLNI
ncbi:hypothetical protein [Chamaesiphon sp. VAR_69_metabat_338]|uniref:hypothetical protein n=1 Tax=Chamaesiphon sp. VAR_69_metabat_338 TaxID=2964704 RepID=UPI00286E613B|nr:hypothetical protein [Chamaesiphon sp. VAR_69_metabat_338]